MVHGVDDQRMGALLRAIRVQRRRRQQDMAQAAGVSPASISRAERGAMSGLTLGSVRSIAAAYGVRVELQPRWRGGDLDRLLAAGHSAMHDVLARKLARHPGWQVTHEATYAFGAERGAIDALCWHPGARLLLIIELKTQVVDVNELLSAMDRRRRLARRMAADRGWIGARKEDADAVSDPSVARAKVREEHGITVATWVLLAEGRTNRRRAAAHAAVLSESFPGTRERLAAILRDPVREVARGAGPWDGLSFLPFDHHGNAKRSPGQVSRVRPRAAEARQA